MAEAIEWFVTSTGITYMADTETHKLIVQGCGSVWRWDAWRMEETPNGWKEDCGTLADAKAAAEGFARIDGVAHG